jgi:6-phosphofructokinase
LQHDKQLNPNNYAVLVISDGAHLTPEKAEQYAPRLSPPIRAELKEGKNGKLLAAGTGSAGGLVGSGMVAAELLGYLTGEEVFLQPLTYLLRTGSPDGQDLLGATNFAIMAARLLKEGKVGRMTAYQKRYNLTDVPIEIVTQGVNGVDIEQMYDVEGYKPKVNLIWAALEE